MIYTENRWSDDLGSDFMESMFSNKKRNIKNQIIDLKDQKVHDQKSEQNEIEEAPISKSDFKEVIDLLRVIAEGITDLRGKLPYLYDEKGRDTAKKGRAYIYKFLNYYDIKNTIKNAGPTDPNDFDSPVYNTERVFEILERYSDIIYVINDDKTEPLFIVVSHEGRTSFSREAIIRPGEIKQYYNIYELRLRSAKVGHTYRVSEYAIRSPSLL